MDQDEIKNKVVELVKINHIEKIPLKEIVLKKKIGEGGQAKVYKGTYRSETVAVKLLENIDWRCLAHEIVIISYLNHPYIPKFYGIVAEDKVLSLVFEFIDGKNLDEYKFDDLNDEIRLKLIKQLAIVLQYIHFSGFIHRDLKPENIMYDKKNDKFYLIDFGISKVLTSNNTTIKTRTKGTLNYLAPETLVVCDYDANDNIVSSIGSGVDCWAYGCIVSWLYSGILPWCNKYNNNEAILQKVLINKKEFPIPDNIKNESIIKLISMCTRIKSEERWYMDDVVKFLEII
jgi:hypothetical protein